MLNATNNLSNISLVQCTKSTFSITWTIIITTLSVTASVTTIAGNILVITAFLLERKLNVISNYFIVSLAATDLLIGFFSMSLYTVYLLLNCWPLGQLLCDIWLSLDYTACLTSQFTVLSITVDRYCSVKIPNIYRSWRTKSKVMVGIIIAWFVPSVLFFTAILGWPLFTERKRRRLECFAEFTAEPVFNTLLTVGYFWLPLLVMLSLYYGIYEVACNLQRKSDERQKKMTTLMAMAGQTMSRIGVGVGWSTNDANANMNNNELTESREPTNENNDTPYYNLPSSEAKSVLNNSQVVLLKVDTSPEVIKSLNYIDDEDVNRAERKLDDIDPSDGAQNFDSQDPELVHHKQHQTVTYVTDSESGAGNQGMMTTLSSSLIGALRKPYYSKLIKRSKNKAISQSQNRARKAFRTISLILGAFLVCWTPYHVLVMIKGFCDDIITTRSCVNEHLYSLSYWLCYMNSPINPFCYALANIQFKRTFVRLLKGDLRKY